MHARPVRQGQAKRPLPASALLPLAISIFGLSPNMVLCVVAFGAICPVLLGTIHGFAAVQPRLSEVSLCLQLSRSDFVHQIGLPNALPDMLAGTRLSLTMALIVSLLGEMIASQPGLARPSCSRHGPFARASCSPASCCWDWSGWPAMRCRACRNADC
jgi:ABC-type nitrate/sulfonate/bicarbonate transport system permease component